MAAGDIIHPSRTVTPRTLPQVLLLAEGADGKIRTVGCDDRGLLWTIAVPHSKVHAGNFYSCVDYDPDVDIISPKWWVVQTPNSAVRAHYVLQISADKAFLIEVFEGITADADGDALTALNSDRNSGNNTTLVFTKDPTNPAGGVKIFNDIVGADNPKARFGGTMRNGAEIILMVNTKYGIKVTVDGDNTAVAMVSEFYEVE